MEKEYLYINKNKDMAEYKETYSDERTLSFMCNKCYNIHPIIVKQEYICHNKTTVVARNGENFEEELNVDVNDVGYKTSIFTIPTTLKLYCPICKGDKDHYILDYKISDIISILNKAGYKTAYSCSGHKEMESIPYIMFKPKEGEFNKYIKMIDSISSYTNKLWTSTYEVIHNIPRRNINLLLDIEKISVTDYLDYKHLTILKDAINKYLNNKEE
jgi:ribosomal protein L44E